MIELYKHQMADFEAVLDAVKWRNYKFIIFMDDLSFEQFEVEYKFLKAFIEGGLEKRPDNVLIYATSNRRHLMKETWATATTSPTICTNPRLCRRRCRSSTASAS